MTQVSQSSMDPEVVGVATRRQFSASEKRALLAEADLCKERGELGAFLPRTRIYSSMLSSWRKQLGASHSEALAPQKHEPKPDASARQIKHPSTSRFVPRRGGSDTWNRRYEAAAFVS